ncbi:hypothetical protein GC177_03070 [bacterium]|nr:hypothetical protein [bacterium]
MKSLVFQAAPSLFLPLLWAAAFALVYASRLPATLADPDILWHLGAGRWFWEHGATRVDPFSYTAGDYPWLNISWWWDAFLYGMQQATGWRGLLLAALLAACVPFILCRTALRNGQGVLAASLAAFAAGIMMTHGVSPRPQTFTLFALACLTALFHLPVLTKRHTVLLAGLLALWANIHGGVLLGFLLTMGWCLWLLWQKREEEALRLALTLFAAFILALLVHPLHQLLPAAILRTLGGEMVRHVAEWRAIQPAKEIIPSLWLLLAGWAAWRHMRAGRWFDTFLILGAGALAIGSIRHIPVMAVLTAIPVSSALDARLGAWNVWRQKNTEYGADMARMKPALAIALLLPLLMVWAGLTLTVRITLPDGPKPGLAWLGQHVKPLHIWNDYNLGGSLIWWGDGHFKNTIDGRAETAYPPSVIRDYLAFMAQSPGWQGRVMAHHPTAIILASNHPLAGAMDAWKIWTRAYADEFVIIWLPAQGQ